MVNVNASLFENLQVKPSDVVVGGATVTDGELLGDVPLELLIFGVSAQKIEGGPSPRPMIVWSCLWPSTRGKLVPRTIRGRAQLTRDLLFFAGERGLQFANAGTGELVSTPTGEGLWSLADGEGRPAVLGVRVRIDKTAGRSAGKGRGFVYLLQACGVAVAQVAAAYPECKALPLSDMIALPLLSDAVEGEAGGGEVQDDPEPTEGPRPARRGGRSR